ncbi:CHAP domain-containing protein [Lentzea aerocolonigenes]|uniref:CHAP domain-containing protein n=3 Tax=Lentzea aerocolonigenes TaxID=68170 RepID=UPI000A85FD80|nr:CHAP domain-containing protein [Lentzea aerocolonigenes]
MIRKTMTTAIVGVILALGAIPASADTRLDVRDLAAANLGKTTCDTNSLGGRGFMDSCRLQHAWCADFARWVWGNRNLYTDRLNPAAGSFYLYGEQNGTIHKDASYVPQVGDAIVYDYFGAGRAKHVALVDAVNADGTIRAINGNSGGTTEMNSTVRYSTGVGRVGQVINGQTVSAFVSPVGAGNVRSAVSRIGVRFTDSSVHVKEGNLYDGWLNEYGGGVVKSEVDGDMIGVLTTSGDLFVKQGNLYETWYNQAGGVKDFSLESSKGRVGIVRTDGTVAVKEGGPQGTWVEQMGNAKEVELSGDYLGVVSNDSTAYVKKGNLYESWTTQLGDVADLEISADRIGALRTDGTLTVKDGGLYGSWVEQTSGVKDFDLSGDYIGVVFNDGLATVKQGTLYAGWVNQLGSAKAVEVNAKAGRIGVLTDNGALTVKEGGPYGSWVDQTSGVAEFQLTNY